MNTELKNFLFLGVSLFVVCAARAEEAEDNPVLDRIEISAKSELFMEASKDVYEEFRSLYRTASGASHPDVYSGFRTYDDFEDESFDKVRKKFDEFRAEVKDIAFKAAREAEGRDRITAARKPALSKVDRAQLETFSEGIREANITIRSHAFTVKCFYILNATLGKEARMAEDPEQKVTLYAVQALFVSEMATVVAESIEALTLDRVEPFLDLYKAELGEINEIIERMNLLVSTSNPEDERSVAEANSK